MKLIDTRNPGAPSRHAGAAREVGMRAEPLRLEWTSAGRAAADEAPAGQLPAIWQERLEERYRQGYEQGHAEGERATTQVLETQRQSVGFEQGRQEGLAEGRRAASAEFEQKLARLDALLRALPAQIEARLAAAEDDMTALCFDTVAKMAGQGSVRAGVVRQVLREAMQQAPGGRAELRVHPDDLAALKAEPAFEEWLSSADATGELPRLVPDQSLRLGGVLLRSAHANLDARLDTQLQSFKGMLLQTRKEERTRRGGATGTPGRAGNPAPQAARAGGPEGGAA